jgi:hypothetical protein
MNVPGGEREPRPSDEELRAMLPMVLNLQKLIQVRLERAIRPGEELGIISVTSCNNHSCS